MKFLYLLAGFLIGSLITSGIIVTDIRSDPLSLVLSFALGILTCFFVLLISWRAVVKACRKVEEEDNREWWQKGEPPPWN